MIGIYDYTVILTYLSLLSATMGIIVSLHGGGHPYGGLFFLLVCGLCDAFDGKVARSKKDRTVFHQKFGIQIDSLSDLVAFGILPVAVGNAMITWSPVIQDFMIVRSDDKSNWWLTILLYIVMLFYALAAMIRLAHYNVTEEDRQSNEGGHRKTYDGLPVTTSSLFFPAILVLHYIIPWDITIAYFVLMAIMGFLFLAKVRIPKAGMKGILVMVAIGAVEFVFLVGLWLKWWQT